MQDTRQDVYDGKVKEAEPHLKARRDAQAEHDAASSDVEKHKSNPELKLREARQRIMRAKMQSDHEARMASLTAEYDRVPEGDKERVGGLIQTATSEFRNKLSAHDAVTEELLEPLTTAQKKLDEAAGKLTAASKALNTFANEEGQRRVRDRRIGSVGAAEQFGQTKAGVFYTLTGMRGHVKKELASKVRGRLGGTGRLNQMLATLRDDDAATEDDRA